jgi:hypothetical protein
LGFLLANYPTILSLPKDEFGIQHDQIRFHRKLLTHLHFFYLIIFEELLPTMNACRKK